MDEAVGQTLLAAVGLGVDRVLGRSGKAHLLARLPGYNRSAERLPWLTLIDLDNDAPCASAAIAEWLPDGPARLMRLRVAIREVESWLIADHVSFAQFLGIARAKLPQAPDGLEDPKDVVIHLARRSSRRVIRKSLVPTDGSGRKEGVTYASDVAEYVRAHWRPEQAAARSPSLGRSLDRLRCFSEQLGAPRRGR